jgi:hypothetical protein
MFAFRPNGSLLFVQLLTKKQTGVSVCIWTTWTCPSMLLDHLNVEIVNILTYPTLETFFTEVTMQISWFARLLNFVTISARMASIHQQRSTWRKYFLTQYKLFRYKVASNKKLPPT